MQSNRSQEVPKKNRLMNFLHIPPSVLKGEVFNSMAHSVMPQSKSQILAYMPRKRKFSFKRSMVPVQRVPRAF
jgi:hypothetical protein